MAFSLQGSPWLRKFGSRGVVALDTTNLPLLQNFQAPHSWISLDEALFVQLQLGLGWAFHLVELDGDHWLNLVHGAETLGITAIYHFFNQSTQEWPIWPQNWCLMLKKRWQTPCAISYFVCSPHQTFCCWTGVVSKCWHWPWVNLNCICSSNLRMSYFIM